MSPRNTRPVSRVSLAQVRVKLPGESSFAGKLSVSGPVHAAVIAVQFVNALIVRQQDALLQSSGPFPPGAPRISPAVSAAVPHCGRGRAACG